MVKFISCCCLLLLHTVTHAQVDKSVVIGTIDSVQSKILNERRNVWVYTPNPEMIVVGIPNTDSNLSYEWMGIYYERRDDKAKALEYYKKAYAIKETPDVKEKLEKLQK
jgi:hypothetical protein